MSEENNNIEGFGGDENEDIVESQESIEATEEPTKLPEEPIEAPEPANEPEPEYEDEYEEERPTKKLKVSLGAFIMSMMAMAIVTAMLTMTLLGNYVKGAVGESLENVRPGQTQGAQNNNGNNGSQSGNPIISEVDLIDLLLSAYFYGDFDKDKLTAESLKAYLAATGDLYAAYYTQEEIEEANNEDAGRMQGIGVNIINSEYTIDGVVYSVLKVTNVMKNSPALEAGIKAGDMVAYVGIGDAKQAITQLGYDEALRLLKGDENTKAEFTIWRVSGENVESLEFSLERREVIADSVYSRVSTVDPKIGIVKIASFDLQTPTQFEDAVEELRAAGCEKFVIDVRYNPGGYEVSVAAVLSYFLEEGDVYIRTEDKYGNMTESKVGVVSGHTGDYAACNVSKEDIGKYKDLDLVVLCNEHTASAGELFTATFKDYEIGEVIGTTTYGKGKMQRIFMLEPYGLEGAVKFTTHMYMSAKSEGYDGIGVKPDIEVELSETAKTYNIYDIPDDKDNQLLKAIEQLTK